MDLGPRLNEIHLQMLAGSRTASRDLFVAALGPLRGFLANRFPSLSADERHDLATDAVVIYVTDPSRCDIAKGSLWTYLCMIANADAIDLLRQSANQRQLLEKKVQTDVEFWASRAKDVFRDENAIDARHLMKMYGNKLVSSEVEAKVLALMLNDEKDTGAFADVLGIDPVAPDTERTVKQAKDRLLVRMKRLRNELGR
jgi:DNA-directed RNA polymerase specialized sigma24 family protein